MNADRQLESFLSSLDEVEILPVDRGIAVLAGRIDGTLSGRGLKIGINDALIGATALQHGLTLVTGNFKHYQRFEAIGFPLRLDNWRNH